MSAKRPENWVEGAYCGARVYSPWRESAGLISAGILYGFVWETDDNGVVFEFEHKEYLARFFIPFERLSNSWASNGLYYMASDVKFIGLVPFRTYRKETKVRPRATFRRGRTRVPIWSELC